MKFYLTPISLAVLLISACGGGGSTTDNLSNTPLTLPGNNSSSSARSSSSAANSSQANSSASNNSSSASNSSAGSSSGPLTATWQAISYVTERTALLAQMNTEGAKGYYYLSGQTFGGNGAERNIYVKESNTTFSYEILNSAASANDFVTQTNAQGARGFAFVGPTTAGDIYVKNNNSSSTYSYQLLSAKNTNASFLSQANAQGTNGYLFSGPYGFVGDSQAYEIYTKQNGFGATYNYALAVSPANMTDQITQANTQGSSGFKLFGAYVFSGEPTGDPKASRNIYVKNTALSSASFAWKSLGITTIGTAFVTQANAEAANAYLYWSSYIVGGNSNNLYFKATNCTGTLCNASLPL